MEPTFNCVKWNQKETATKAATTGQDSTITDQLQQLHETTIFCPNSSHNSLKMASRLQQFIIYKKPSRLEKKHTFHQEKLEIKSAIPYFVITFAHSTLRESLSFFFLVAHIQEQYFAFIIELFIF